MEIGKNKGKARIARIGEVQQTTDARQKESDVHRLKTLEWLAEFVMACPEGSIPVSHQQCVIREVLKVTEMDVVNLRLG